MKKLVIILAGEPESINSEIIVKAWKKSKKKIIIIGSFLLIKKQLKKIRLSVPLIKIKNLEEFKNKKFLHVLDVPLKFLYPFNVPKKNKKKYIFECFNIAHNLAIQKKIKGFINAPIDKKIFDSKYNGVTEYLSMKNKVKGKEVMMIFNNKLSVVPITTHIDIKNVEKNIKKEVILKKIETINNFFIEYFNKRPRIAILGLNPHNSENRSDSIESKLINPQVKILRDNKINITGPYPADTIFTNMKKLKYDVVVGMYHDQVLGPFKALYGYNAINITLGLRYLRISPDHGTAVDLIGKNKANPQSLINSINFFTKTHNDQT